MRNIRLNDGTVYTVDRCGGDSRNMAANITSRATLASLVEVFNIPEKVSHIEHYYDGTKTDRVVYDGYTELIGACVTDTGVTITLRKGAT